MNRIFKNNNGMTYCILEGDIGGPALMLNLHSGSFVITYHLNKSDWNSGMYFPNLKSAYNEWRKINWSLK